jgi:murein hydrolase activator
MKKRKQTVQGEITQEEQKIQMVQRNLARLQNEEQFLLQEESSAQNRLEEAKRVLSIRSEEYRMRLRSMYKRQRISAAHVIFSAGSVSAFLRGYRMLESLAVADLEVLNSIRHQNQIIATEMTGIQNAIEAKRALENARLQESEYLSEAQKKRKDLLAVIARDQKTQEEKNQRWEKEYRESMALMDRLIQDQISRDRTVSPGTLKNYSFMSRRGKLPWPVGGRVVSRFGKTVDPRTNTTTINRGVEFETKTGEQVRTIGSGQVVKTQSIRGYGNFVMIHHFPGHYTIYAHLSDILVSEGDIVQEGSVIGLAGSSGLVDNRISRLLIEVLNGRTPEDPLRWLRPDQRSSGG